MTRSRFESWPRGSTSATCSRPWACIPRWTVSAPVIGGECVGYRDRARRQRRFGRDRPARHRFRSRRVRLTSDDSGRPRRPDPRCVTGSRGGHVRHRVSHRVARTARGRAAGARRTGADPLRHRRCRTGGGFHRQDDRSPDLHDGGLGRQTGTAVRVGRRICRRLTDRGVRR